MENDKSPHILVSSSNLLGFCFLVLSSIKGLGLPQRGVIDETLALCVVIFAMSSFFSFASIRSRTLKKTQYYEAVADVIFMVGLFVIVLSAVFLAFDVIMFVR